MRATDVFSSPLLAHLVELRALLGGEQLAHARHALGAQHFQVGDRLRLGVGNASASRTGLLIGAGAMYDLSRNVFARAGWDRYAQLGSDDTGKGHADVYSIGVGYRF
jgi:opacity protein-like surface antigen